MASLVVFVHGLGANEHAFWGTTPGSIRGSDLLREQTEVKFWGYETTSRPRPLQRFLGPVGAGAPLETIDSLGEHLWSKLRLWFRDGDYDSVRLLGHSMGGLVVAAALGRGVEESRSHDQAMIEAITGVAFVATPLGGASLANRTGALFELFGRNVHVEDLMPGSVSRRHLVNRFIDRALRDVSIPLTIFRASNDQVVAESEVDEPLVTRPDVSFKKDVLTGNHSGCVQNLEPESENLRMLARWTRGPLSSHDIADLGRLGKPTSVFVSRPSLLNERQEHFWGVLEEHMMSSGLQPRTLGLGIDVPKQEGGMYDVLDLLEQCHGAVVLGLSQVKVERATFKAGTNKPRDAEQCEFVTPWNHMEACMAFANKIPLLIIREESVYPDGVFDRSCLRMTPYVTDLSKSSLQGRFDSMFQSWIEEVAARASDYW